MTNQSMIPLKIYAEEPMDSLDLLEEYGYKSLTVAAVNDAFLIGT